VFLIVKHCWSGLVGGAVQNFIVTVIGSSIGQSTHYIRMQILHKPSLVYWRDCNVQ